MKKARTCFASSAAGLVVALAFAACSGGGGSSSSSSSGSNDSCGDGAIDTSETCDGAEVGGETCEDLGFGPGTLGCQADCKDFDRSLCGAPTTCMNGMKDGVELCDGDDVGDATCVSLGYGDGTLACTDNCGAFDTSGCAAPMGCGDGKKNGGEVCDANDLGSATCEGVGEGPGTLVCAADCLSFDTSGCECKPACGGLECGPDPKCGVSCGECDAYSACESSACVKVCDLLPLDADGALDIDLPVVTLSGAVTVNGGAIPNDGMANGLSRGAIELRNVDTGWAANIDLKETGGVTYSLPIFAGTYDVFVHSNPANYQNALPIDQRALVMKGLVITQTMTQDFDLKMVTLSGKITVNGAAVPNDGLANGLSRGDVLLRDIETGDEQPISLNETGAVTYSTKIFAGTFDVLVHSNPANYQNSLPVDQRALIQKSFSLQQTMTQDFDIKMVTLSGKITVNGAAVPNDGLANGLSRGDVLLRDTETFDEQPISLNETGPVTYSTKIFAGTFDVIVHSNPANYQNVLPVDQRGMVMKGLAIQQTMTQDFDLKMVTTGGNVTLNNDPMPNDGMVNGLSRGDLLFRDTETLDDLPVTLGETGPVNYAVKMWAGTFDILVHSNPANYQNALPIDQTALVKKGVSIQASGDQKFNLIMLQLTGKVTLNGGAVPNDGSMNGLSRGDLLLRDTETLDETPISLAETGPVTYSIKMFAGTFDVLVHSNPANYQTVLPVDQRAFVMAGLSIQQSMAQDFDLKQITLTGKITQNGGAIPNDGSMNGLARGSVILRDLRTADDNSIDLGESGAVNYTLKMFAGAYDVLVYSNPANYQTSLPIDQRARILRGCLMQ